MASKIHFLVLILFLSRVESASFLERSYEYVISLGKSLAPTLLNMLDCLGEDDMWGCAREKTGKLLESWDQDVDKQRTAWREAADAEVSSSGRSIEELPSKLGTDVEQSLFALADVMQHGVARALSKHHESGGGIDSITISTGGGDKKKKMKKKKQPAKIHLVHPMMMMNKMKEQDRGFRNTAQSWVIGRAEDAVNATDVVTESVNANQNFRRARVMSEASMSVREGRGIFSEMWEMGEKAIDAVAEGAALNDNAEDGIEDKSSLEEQRGKKKKKKKAILKLLILGAVLKAKIGTLLQILSFKLQVKFFLIALVGLGINLARFWLDLKKSHHQQPQKVIYYEHAQHQHHYDHEEEPGWGPWSRSMEPEETDAEIDMDVHPYKAQIQRNVQNYPRPIITRV